MGGYGTDAKSGLVKFANVFIDLITALAGAWLLFTIIWNGYTIIVSQKSAEKFAEATKNILYSILGLMIVAFSYLIAGYVSKLIFGDSKYINEPLEQVSRI